MATKKKSPPKKAKELTPKQKRERALEIFKAVYDIGRLDGDDAESFAEDAIVIVDAFQQGLSHQLILATLPMEDRPVLEHVPPAPNTAASRRRDSEKWEKTLADMGQIVTLTVNTLTLKTNVALVADVCHKLINQPHTIPKAKPKPRPLDSSHLSLAHSSSGPTQSGEEVPHV